MTAVPIVVIRGAGEMATGCAAALVRAGWSRVLLLETSSPRAVRRRVCLSEAVFDGTATVEELRARLVSSPAEAIAAWGRSTALPLLVDPGFACKAEVGASVVVDATLRKRPADTHPGLAPVVVGLGPGFVAPRDCTAVIETQRGPTLGQMILDGGALDDTGIPADVAGFSTGRVLKVATGGLFRTTRSIGERVTAGEALGEVVAPARDRAIVAAAVTGRIRGLLRDRTEVAPFEKLGDVDPVDDPGRIVRISEKALAIGAGVVRALRHAGVTPNNS